MLSVVPAVVVLAACGAPEAAAPAVPVAAAAAVAPVTHRATAPTSQSLGVVPVDMGPAPAEEAAARAAAQAGRPSRAPTQRHAAPERTSGARPAPKPAPKPAPQPIARPAPEPPASRCDANYTPCVPTDSDVDCAGGAVVDADVYGLDAGEDGVGCE
jgi:hypothetical protein